MNKFFNCVLGLMVAVIVATWVVGCGSDSKEQARPTKTLTYTDSLQEGGPGYVDVYEQVMTVTTGTSTSSGSSSSSSSSSSASSARPAIIAIHGGAWRSGGRWQVAPVAREFASKGFIVFAPDYSLAPRAKWPAPLLDLQTLVRYMRTNADTLKIDPKRIGAWGGSAGGHLATMLALHDDQTLLSTPTSTTSNGSGSGTTTTTTTGSGSGTTTTSGSGSSSNGQSTSESPPLEEIIVTSGRVRAAVDAFGPADLTIPNGMAPDEDGILRDFLGAPRFQLSDLQLLNASTITYARPDASVLILHGTADSFVSIDHSEHLYKALSDKGADVNFIRVYGGMHDFGTYHAPEAWSTTLQFFNTRLSGNPTPLPKPPCSQSTTAK